MKQSAAYFVIGLGVLLMVGIAWWFGAKEAPVEEDVPVPTAPVISEGLSIYASGEHGFLITYPEGAILEESFEGKWRNGARTLDTSTNILSITTFSTTSDTSYPRYFYTMVRVAFSGNQEEVRECLVARKGSGEMPLQDVVLGDTTFKVFSFGDAAMMQYTKGTSYRAVHDGKCWAIETIARGSSYREESSSEDLDEQALESEILKLQNIAESFRFAR